MDTRDEVNTEKPMGRVLTEGLCSSARETNLHDQLEAAAKCLEKCAGESIGKGARI